MVLHDPASSGPRAPLAGSPALAPGVVRRTTRIDTSSPTGWSGPVEVAAAAVDAIGARGTVHSVELRAAVDRVTRELRALTVSPADDRVAALVGAPVAGGFRGRLAACLPAGGPLHAVLDDFPGAALVAGYAMLRADAISGLEPGRLAHAVNQCAGWAEAGAMVTLIKREGRSPTPLGPPAPPLGDAWDPLPQIPAHGMRRVRRIDLRSDGTVDAFFRDSHMDAEAGETVVHEYAIRAVVDLEAMVLVSAEADPDVLPWLECPAAVASAGWVAGTRLAELRADVRRRLNGTSTCTHLNDTLRALADVPFLAALLPSDSPDRVP